MPQKRAPENNDGRRARYCARSSQPDASLRGCITGDESMSAIRKLIQDMRLLGMAATLDKTTATAVEEKWDYSEYLDTLLQSEYDWREDERSKRRIKAAKFKIRPTFEDFDFAASRSITKAQVKEVYNLKWIEQGRPLLLVGQTGVGKTFLAQAAGLHACQQKKSVLFMTITSWLENLQLARSTGTYLKYRDKLAKPDLLIIDERSEEH